MEQSERTDDDDEVCCADDDNEGGNQVQQHGENVEGGGGGGDDDGHHRSATKNEILSNSIIDDVIEKLEDLIGGDNALENETVMLQDVLSSPPLLPLAEQTHLLASPSSMNHIDSCSSSSSVQCSGVRRKSPKYTPPIIPQHHSFDSTDTLPGGSSNGTKKKIRRNGVQKSPSLSSSDYYAIWTVHSPQQPDGHLLTAADAIGHRPLERSWPMLLPPSAGRSAKPDSFNFDIVDTDEPPALGPDPSVDDQIDFIPGEFYDDRRRSAGDGQTAVGARKQLQQQQQHPSLRLMADEENAPLATPETDGSLSDCIFRLAGGEPPMTTMTKTIETIKPLLKKKIGPDSYISTIRSQKVVTTTTSYNFPPDVGGGGVENGAVGLMVEPSTLTEGSASLSWSVAVPISVGHERCKLKGEFIPLKPHKPLTRQQMSNGGGASVPSNGQQNKHFALCRKPSPLSPRQQQPQQHQQQVARSPPSGSSTRSASPLDHFSSPEGKFKNLYS